MKVAMRTVLEQTRPAVKRSVTANLNFAGSKVSAKPPEIGRKGLYLVATLLALGAAGGPYVRGEKDSVVTSLNKGRTASVIVDREGNLSPTRYSGWHLLNPIRGERNIKFSTDPCPVVQDLTIRGQQRTYFILFALEPYSLPNLFAQTFNKTVPEQFPALNGTEFIDWGTGADSDLMFHTVYARTVLPAVQSFLETHSDTAALNLTELQETLREQGVTLLHVER